jgi:hypothetical protein
MPHKIQLPSPWAWFLRDVDESLTSEVEIHCSGGFVLTVLYEVPRTTSDLDYLCCVPRSASDELADLAGADSKLAKKHRLHLQRVGGVTDLPEDYEDRLSSLDCGLSRLTIRVLDPYDLVLSKLTRNSPKDREDVKAVACKLQLSFRRLMEIFDREMKPWLPNLEREQLTLKLWKEYFSA